MSEHDENLTQPIVINWGYLICQIFDFCIFSNNMRKGTASHIRASRLRNNLCSTTFRPEYPIHTDSLWIMGSAQRGLRSKSSPFAHSKMPVFLWPMSIFPPQWNWQFCTWYYYHWSRKVFDTRIIVFLKGFSLCSAIMNHSPISVYLFYIQIFYFMYICFYYWQTLFKMCLHTWQEDEIRGRVNK